MRGLYMETNARLISEEELDLLISGEPYFLEKPVEYSSYSNKSRWVLFRVSILQKYINDEGETTVYWFEDRDGRIGPFHLGDYNERTNEGWRLWLGAPDGHKRMDARWK